MNHEITIETPLLDTGPRCGIRHFTVRREGDITKVYLATHNNDSIGECLGQSHHSVDTVAAAITLRLDEMPTNQRIAPPIGLRHCDASRLRREWIKAVLTDI